ncbi:polyprenyl synthetase family protein [bacterium]|nr:polyprenyl synthetase family protein [bacterium]
MDDIQRIYQPILKEKEKVELILQEQLKDVPPELSAPASSILFSNGKRLRPVLLLNVAKMLGKVKKQACYLAAALELIHTASLIHDDIIDEADLRRGVPSINSKWGNKIAVLVGDLLVAKAARLALKWGDKNILALVAGVIEKMSRGEALELALRGRDNIGEKDYLKIIDLKTASLFAAAARIGAILGGANQEQEKNLYRFGRYLGLAFQITDDILNIISDEQVMGKPTKTDFKKGNLTLPYILSSREGKSQGIMPSYPSMEITDETVYQTIGVDKARQKAEKYIANAKKCLENFPPSPAKEAVLLMSDFILIRRK